MRTFSFIFALLVASGAAGTAWGADLAKIDRTIAKEPAYQGKPKYCLLVFGPEATTRIWLVQDGNTLYIDRNGNGDLTEAGEKVAWNTPNLPAGAVLGPDGKPLCTVSLHKRGTTMRLTVMTEAKQRILVGDPGASPLVFNEAKQRYLVGDPDGDPLVFADRPSEAPVVHVGGPLSIALSYYGPWVLRVRVGTLGLGTGTFAALVLPNVTPVAEIEYPPRQPGGPPIVRRVKLTDS